jgi:hypothetical protein
MTQQPDNDESYIDEVWEQIEIYEGADTFLRTYAAAAQPAAALYAAHWAQSEICNGGFMQLFGNSTGVLSPEAAQGFHLISMPKTAAILEAAMEQLATPFPRERPERQALLAHLPKNFFDELQKKFYAELDSENGGFTVAVSSFLARQRTANK